MKQILIPALIAVTLFGCSKSSSNKQTTPSNTVTINSTAYATIKIGSQLWTIVNYNGAGGVNYNNSNTNIPADGKLYTLTEAKAITLPSGWTLPSQADYYTLVTSLGATQNNNGGYVISAANAEALMAKTSWTIGGGTNSSGFNALAVGYYDNSAFAGANTDAVFLTTSTLTSEPGIPSSFDIYQDNTGTSAVMTDIVATASDRGAIRFVKDN